MRYYIEAKKGSEVLREFSRVCGDLELDGVMVEVVKAVKAVAEKVTVYSHDGLHNASSIEEISSMVLPEAA